MTVMIPRPEGNPYFLPAHPSIVPRANLSMGERRPSYLPDLARIELTAKSLGAGYSSLLRRIGANSAERSLLAADTTCRHLHRSCLSALAPQDARGSSFDTMLPEFYGIFSDAPLAATLGAARAAL
jgi:hypothetical protein